MQGRNFISYIPEETDHRPLRLKGEVLPLDILVLLLYHVDGSEEADVIQVELGLGRPEIIKKNLKTRSHVFSLSSTK